MAGSGQLSEGDTTSAGDDHPDDAAREAAGALVPEDGTPAAVAFETGQRMAREDVIGADWYLHTGLAPAHLMTSDENAAVEAMPFSEWSRWWWRGWTREQARREEA